MFSPVGKLWIKGSVPTLSEKAKGRSKGYMQEMVHVPTFTLRHTAVYLDCQIAGFTWAKCLVGVYNNSY